MKEGELTEKVAGDEEKDRYWRVLGEVRLGRRHINLEMVQEGMARHYVQDSKSKERSQAEVAVRQSRRGSWADREPVPP